MARNRLSAALSLLLVFLSGTLVGAVSYRLYMVKTVSTANARPPRDPEEVRRRRINEMRERVNLDDTQLVRLNEIYDHTRQEFDALKKKGDAEGHAIWEKQRTAVRDMLRADQLPLYEKYQKELDEMRRRRMQQMKKK